MADEKRYELVDTQQLIEDLALFDWKREMIAEGQLTDEQLYDIHVEQDGTWTKRVSRTLHHLAGG